MQFDILSFVTICLIILFKLWRMMMFFFTVDSVCRLLCWFLYSFLMFCVWSAWKWVIYISIYNIFYLYLRLLTKEKRFCHVDYGHIRTVCLTNDSVRTITVLLLEKNLPGVFFYWGIAWCGWGLPLNTGIFINF